MPANRAQRHVRAISNEHCDDTAIEMQLVDQAIETYAILRESLEDKWVTSAEARKLADALAATIHLANESLQRNVMVEQQLTALAQEMGDWNARTAAA